MLDLISAARYRIKNLLSSYILTANAVKQTTVFWYLMITELRSLSCEISPET